MDNYFCEFRDGTLTLAGLLTRLDMLKDEERDAQRAYRLYHDAPEGMMLMCICNKCGETGHLDDHCEQRRKRRNEEYRNATQPLFDIEVFNVVYDKEYLAKHVQILKDKHDENPNNDILERLFKEYNEKLQKIVDAQKKKIKEEREAERDRLQKRLAVSEQEVLRLKQELLKVTD